MCNHCVLKGLNKDAMAERHSTAQQRLRRKHQKVVPDQTLTPQQLADPSIVEALEKVSLMHKATENTYMVTLPCTVELLTLLDHIIHTPKRNLSVVTVYAKLEPNSTSKWRASDVGCLRTCRQMFFHDNRRPVRDLYAAISDAMLANHSADYSVLPVHMLRVNAENAHKCTCGLRECDGTYVRAQKRRDAIPQNSAEHVTCTTGTSIANSFPNACLLTCSMRSSEHYEAAYRQIVKEANEREINTHKLHSDIGANSATMEMQNWLTYDRTSMLPIIPMQGDEMSMEPEIGETMSNYVARLQNRYSLQTVFTTADESVTHRVAHGDEPLCCQPKDCVITRHNVEPDVLLDFHNSSEHCSKLCYKKLRFTIMRLLIEKQSLRERIGVAALKATVSSPAAKIPIVPVETLVRAGHQKDEPYYSDADSDTEEDYDSDEEMDEAELKRAFEDAASIKSKHESLFDFFDRKFSGAKCTDSDDCNCLTEQLLRDCVGNHYSFDIVPLPSAAFYREIGDSIYDCTSPTMCEMVAEQVTIGDHMVNAIRNFFVKREQQQETERPSDNDAPSAYIADYVNSQPQFEYSAMQIFQSKDMQQRMRTFFGNFTVVRLKGDVISFRHTRDPVHASETSFIASIEKKRVQYLVEADAAEKKRIAVPEFPYGKIYTTTHCPIDMTHTEAIALAKRYFPEKIKKESTDLTHIVIDLGMVRTREQFDDVDDWLHPFVRYIINIGRMMRNNVLEEISADVTIEDFILGVVTEKRIMAEIAVTANMRLVITRLTAYYMRNIHNICDVVVACLNTMIMIAICKLVVQLAVMRREETLRLLAQPPVQPKPEPKPAKPKIVRTKSISPTITKKKTSVEQKVEPVVAKTVVVVAKETSKTTPEPKKPEVQQQKQKQPSSQQQPVTKKQRAQVVTIDVQSSSTTTSAINMNGANASTVVPKQQKNSNVAKKEASQSATTRDMSDTLEPVIPPRFANRERERDRRRIRQRLNDAKDKFASQRAVVANSSDRSNQSQQRQHEPGYEKIRQRYFNKNKQVVSEQTQDAAPVQNATAAVDITTVTPTQKVSPAVTLPEVEQTKTKEPQQQTLEDWFCDIAGITRVEFEGQWMSTKLDERLWDAVPLKHCN